MAIDRLLERIANIESDIGSIKHDIGILINNLQTVQNVTNNINNYLISMIISENDGDREIILNEVKVLYKGVPDNIFNDNIVPIIDKMIEFYNNTEKVVKEENKDD